MAKQYWDKCTVLSHLKHKTLSAYFCPLDTSPSAYPSNEEMSIIWAPWGVGTDTTFWIVANGTVVQLHTLSYGRHTLLHKLLILLSLGSPNQSPSSYPTTTKPAQQ
jgi:hypothetical protein